MLLFCLMLSHLLLSHLLFCLLLSHLLFCLLSSPWDDCTSWLGWKHKQQHHTSFFVSTVFLPYQLIHLNFSITLFNHFSLSKVIIRLPVQWQHSHKHKKSHRYPKPQNSTWKMKQKKVKWKMKMKMKNKHKITTSPSIKEGAFTTRP